MKSHRNDGTAAAARQRSRGWGRFPNKQVCEEWPGGLFEKTSKLVPVYTACQVVKPPSGAAYSKSWHILTSGQFRNTKAEGFRFPGSPLPMNCQRVYGSDAKKAPVTKWQAVETCTGSLIFADPPVGRIRKNCLLGEASPVPFETICDGGCAALLLCCHATEGTFR